MKILLVHNDKFLWAASIRAENLKKQWKDDEVDIVNADNLPDGSQYDIIHFLFSGGITRYKEYILKHKAFTTLASYRTLEGHWDNLEDLKEIYDHTVCVCHNPDLAKRVNGVYIPNGVDTEMFSRKFVVGFVGGTIGKDDHKGFKLIEKACDELGLELLAVNCPYHMMPSFYRSIDCLVIASKSEGCNNPTLEALAMNKPVISTDTGIAKELGLTIVNRDVESIKKELIKLSGRIQILKKYTWEIVAAQYKKLYVEKHGTT
jgi:hypothetical protein